MKHICTKFVAMLLVIAMIAGVLPFAFAANVGPFTDVKDTDWFASNVQYVYDNGLMNGTTTTTFEPESNLTRAQTAMVLWRIAGQPAPTAKAPFTDLVDAWYRDAIAWAAEQKVVNGRGDGTFDPNGNVTVAEAAKMVLVALGYNAGVENYVGANWQINVDGRANPLGLYDDLSYTTTSAELTRDNAAQMLYNALDVHMVTYDYIITGTAENALTTKPQINDTDKGTLLEEKFDAVKVEGVVVANEVANLESGADKGAALDANRTRIDIDEDADQEWYTGTQTFKVPSTIDDLGRYVSVYVKRENNSTNAQVLGSVIVSEDNKVVTDYSADPIEDVVDDNNLDLEDNALIAENYKGLTELTSSKASASNTAGQEKILIDNDDDGRVDYVLLNTYYFGKVTSYVTSGDGSITVTDNNDGHPAFTADDKDDVVGFDDVAKDDYVIAAWIGGDLHVALADTVTGNLEGYKENDKNLVTKLTVDGEDYSVSHVDGYTGGVDDIRAAKTYGEEYLDNEATFYLTKGGYIAAAGEVDENAYKYALVLATGTTGLEDRVRVALSDGTTATYDYVTSGNAVKNPQVGTVYRYTINSAGDIRLTAITATTKTGTASFEKGLTAVKAGSDTLYASGSTAFFYVGVTTLGGSNIDSSDVSVYAGYQNAPDLDKGKTITAVVYPREGNENSNRAGAVVFYGDASLATGNVDDVLYISDKGTSTTDYTNADAFIAGNKVSDQESTIKVDITSPLTRRVAYTYTINSDGYYELDALTVGEDGVDGDFGVETASSSTFVSENGDEYVITSETLLVDDSDYLDDPTAELGAGPYENDYVTWVTYNSDNEAILVVISNSSSSGGSGSSSDSDSTTRGDATLTVEGDDLTAEDVRIASNGNLSYTFGVPTSLAADGDTVSYSYAVYIDDSRVERGTQTGEVIDGEVDGTVADLAYDEGDDVEIIISNVTKEGGSSTGDNTGDLDTILSGSTASYSYTLASNGKLSMTVDYTAPEYAADNATVEMTLNVLEDGAQYDTMTVSGSADGTLTGTTSYTGTGTLTFSVADETLSAVKVQYVDGSGNALTLDSSATNTEELSTDEATAIQFTLSDRAYDDGKAGNYTISGVEETSNLTSTATPGTEVDTSSNVFTASGDGYVTITVTGLTEAATVYDVTATDELTTDLALFNWGITGTDADKTLTVDVSGATGITPGSTATVTFKLSAAPAANGIYGYRVVCEALDFDEVLTNDTAENASIRLRENIALTADDITVTAVENLAVESYTWDSGAVTITFNKAVSTPTAASSNADINITSVNSISGYEVSVSEDGLTVTITPKDTNDFAENDTVAVTTSVTAEDGEALSSSVTITLGQPLA